MMVTWPHMLFLDLTPETKKSLWENQITNDA